MKALEEVGNKKIIKFIIYGFLSVIYHRIINHWLYFPPFRKMFLQVLGAKIGRDSILMDINFFNWYHKGPGGLKIGNECFIGDEVLIDLYGNVVLEDQVTIAQRVTILTHMNVGYKNHPLQKFFPRISKPVILKNGCVVGASSTILPGVIIGSGSFVAAGSVVTQNVPSKTLVGGVPAKEIRKIR